jgi:hypothetical protein
MERNAQVVRMSIIWSDDAVATPPVWPSHAAYLAECDRAFTTELHLVTNFRAFSPKSPTVVCVARNEAMRIEAFVRHYMELGASGIHLIDNASTDGTADIAVKCSSSVTVWRTSASYARAAYGQMWSGGLVRRYGLGHWILNVDADEFLVYDGMKQHGLEELQNLLAKQSQTRMRTPMIDMYAGPGASTAKEASAIEQAPYFDSLSQGQEDSVRFTGMWPCNYGPRARIMKILNIVHRPNLQKIALARWDRSTAYANVHMPFPFDQNPLSPRGALLHFKFLPDFAAKVSEAIAAGEHWRDGLEYRSYQDWLAVPGRPALYDASISVLYAGPVSLVQGGLLEPLNWQTSAQ